MKQHQNSSESGQVLVILVLAIVGLLAFTALAVDGGLIFTDRRAAQNAADASVLAGGYRIANSLEDYTQGFSFDYDTWDCAAIESSIYPIAEPDALTQAANNNYPIDETDGSSLDMDCQVEDHGVWQDKYVDTDTVLVSDVETSFVHFAFGGTVENTVEAISRVRPRMPLAFGFAIYANGDGCGTGGNPGGVIFNGGGGDSEVIVNGGGILADTCVIGNGGIDVIVNDGDIGFGSETECNGSGCSIDPAPQEQTEPLPDWAILFPTPDCSGLSPQSSNGDGTMVPGIYTSNVAVHNNDNLTIEPGLYCFQGADFTATGGEIYGNGVTFYMNNGDISFSGGAHAELSAPTYVEDPEDGVQGMLVYVDEDYDGNISFTGNGGTTLTGVIFAPNPDSTIDISGTSDDVFNTQLIAGQVTIGGDATVEVNFLDGQVYWLPAQLTLQK